MNLSFKHSVSYRVSVACLFCWLLGPVLAPQQTRADIYADESEDSGQEGHVKSVSWSEDKKSCQVQFEGQRGEDGKSTNVKCKSAGTCKTLEKAKAGDLPVKYKVEDGTLASASIKKSESN
mgnify:CR=1 FL=1